MNKDDLRQRFDLELSKGLAERQRLDTQNVKKMFSRKGLEQGMLECFDLVGGVPRLALWANDPENYHEFLKLLMKFAPKEAEKATGATIHFMSSIPDSPLNNPEPDHQRDVIEHDESMPEDRF